MWVLTKNRKILINLNALTDVYLTERGEDAEVAIDLPCGETIIIAYLFATYSLAKEGLDIPRLDRLFLTTPVKYHAVVIQSIGRIARTFPGKGPPMAYDFVDDRIGYCVRAHKERRRHYRKAGVYFVGGDTG